MELQEEVHNFSVSVIVFGVILSIRTRFCFVLQTEVLSAGKYTNHGHNGVGGDYGWYGWFWLSVLLSLLCPELQLPLSLK